MLSPCNINWTLGVQNQQKVYEKCESWVSFCETYLDMVFNNVFDMTLNHPPLGRPWESYDDTNFWGINITYYIFMNHHKFLQKPLIDNYSKGHEKHEVIINNGREHCSYLTKNEGMIFMAKKGEAYLAKSIALIPNLLQGLITKFPSSQEMLKIPNLIKCIHHDIKRSSFPNLSKLSAKLSWILPNAVHD